MYAIYSIWNGIYRIRMHAGPFLLNYSRRTDSFLSLLFTELQTVQIDQLFLRCSYSILANSRLLLFHCRRHWRGTRTAVKTSTNWRKPTSWSWLLNSFRCCRSTVTPSVCLCFNATLNYMTLRLSTRPYNMHYVTSVCLPVGLCLFLCRHFVSCFLTREQKNS